MTQLTEAYRIVEVDRGNIKTLFHGLNAPDGYTPSSRRSRVLMPGVWYAAERRLVRDGGGQEPYESGFNVLLTKAAAVKYLQRFTAPRTLRIARVLVDGLRPKPTNPEVMLADNMKIEELCSE